MTYPTVARTFVVGTALAIVVTLAGCSSTLPGQLGEDQQIQASCPKDHPIDSFGLVDGTGSDAADSITAERLKSIETITRRGALCGGHLTVRAFSSGSAATTEIYDGDLDASAPTEQAHLRKAEKLTVSMMAQITAAYEPAIAALPGGGTDIAGLYRLLGERATQFPGMRLEATILTDGLNNIGFSLEGSLTSAQASALADQVPVPHLPGASLSVVGIGRVAGNPVPSGQVDSLKVFYTRLCQRTGAAQCLVVTDGR